LVQVHETGLQVAFDIVGPALHHHFFDFLGVQDQGHVQDQGFILLEVDFLAEFAVAEGVKFQTEATGRQVRDFEIPVGISHQISDQIHPFQSNGHLRDGGHAAHFGHYAGNTGGQRAGGQEEM